MVGKISLLAALAVMGSVGFANAQNAFASTVGR